MSMQPNQKKKKKEKSDKFQQRGILQCTWLLFKTLKVMKKQGKAEKLSQPREAWEMLARCNVWYLDGMLERKQDFL